MFPLDIAIWERFLDKYAEQYTGFDYDIKVGTGAPIEPGLASNYAHMIGTLSKYRIDCVGHSNSSIDIIEVKPAASTTAIGQLVMYTKLFMEDFSPDLKVRGVIVTDREMPDMKLLTEHLGFGYYIV